MRNPTVSRADWIAARQELLNEEKRLARAHDELKARRRGLPWLEIEKQYSFETSQGMRSLGELFQGKSQLIIYHFMFAPEWDTPCSSCSFWADHFDSLRWHLGERDAAFVAVSRASIEQIEAFKARMGWRFDWHSSGGSSFPYDCFASFRPEEVSGKDAFFNWAHSDPMVSDREGASEFFRDPEGKIYLTYATFARGIDMLNGTYSFLDICPKGRDEGSFASPQDWVRFHDEYSS